MIRQERAVSASYDGASDTLRLICETGEISAREQAEVQLLLDEAGHLVGVDLGGEGFQRQVVMLGPHEAVASQKPAAAEIVRGADRGVLYVSFGNARGAARGNEKN